MNEKLRRLTIGAWLGGFLTVFITHGLAYYTPSKKIIVDINAFGEATIEWYFLQIIFLMTMWLLSTMLYEKYKK